jgi:hypothetical protein
MSVLGLALGAQTVSCTSTPRRGAAVQRDLPWTPESPESLAEALRSLELQPRAIAIAVGLPFLSVQRVELPPAPATAQRAMLRMEPDRWFPLASYDDVAVAVAPGSTLAYACDGAWLARVIRAVESVAPVVRIEPAPTAVARTTNGTGRAVLADRAGTAMVVTVADGLVREVRRASDAAAPATPVALGVTLGALDDDTTALVSATQERTMAARRTRRVLLWSGVAAMAVLVAGAAVSRSRDRTLAAVEAEVTAARTAAAPGRALLDRAFLLDREADAIQALRATTPDIAEALRRLGERLPRAAVAQRVRVSGTSWQVEGNAPTSAAVLEALAGEASFTSVRFLAPSTRYQEPSGPRETWSIGFTLR